MYVTYNHTTGGQVTWFYRGCAHLCGFQVRSDKASCETLSLSITFHLGISCQPATVWWRPIVGKLWTFLSNHRLLLCAVAREASVKTASLLIVIDNRVIVSCSQHAAPHYVPRKKLTAVPVAGLGVIVVVVVFMGSDVACGCRPIKRHGKMLHAVQAQFVRLARRYLPWLLFELRRNGRRRGALHECKMSKRNKSIAGRKRVHVKGWVMDPIGRHSLWISVGMWLGWSA